MASISNLNLQPSEDLNLDTYAVTSGGSGKTFPPKGRYTLRVRENFPNEAFGATKAGALSVAIDPTIVGPVGEGRQLKFTRLSAKTFKRGNSEASQLGDFLKACGITGVVPGDPQKLADLAESTANRTFEADLDWEAYAKNPDGSVVDVKGMQNFPKRDDGSYQPYLLSDHETDEQGQPKKIFANLRIQRFVMGQ
jgi:hypothetical protein